MILEKRRSVGRPRKSEIPVKQKASTSKETMRKREPPPEPIPPPLVEPPLPMKIQNDQPLPTTRERQASHLSHDEYQSISSSGVATAALAMSNACVLQGHLFEVYWKKHTKKRWNNGELKDNPERNTMSAALGRAWLTVGPSRFEVELYRVFDPLAPTAKASQQSFQNPGSQYTSNQYYEGQVAPFTPTGHQHPQHGPAQAQYGQHPAHAQAYHGDYHTHSHNAFSSTAHNSYQTPAHAQPRHSQSQFPPYPYEHQPAPLPPPASPVQRPPPRPPSPKGQDQDPVIHMLAQRASKDSQLTELMKIVASGKANGEELRIFQTHIDELSAIVKRQKEEEERRKKMAPPHVSGSQSSFGFPNAQLSGDSGSGAIASPSNHAVPALHSGQPAYARPPHAYPTAAPSAYSQPPQTHPQAYYYPQTSQSFHRKHNIPAPRTKAIVMQFLGEGASFDRYMFPRDSILEYPEENNGKVLIASFCVVRKGKNFVGDSSLATSGSTSNPLSMRYDKNKEYYECVTVHLSCEKPDVLAVFKEGVASQDEVTRHMEDIFDRAERAEERFLAFRLPRPDGQRNSEERAPNRFDEGVRRDSKRGSGASTPLPLSEKASLRGRKSVRIES